MTVILPKKLKSRLIARTQADGIAMHVPGWTGCMMVLVEESLPAMVIVVPGVLPTLSSPRVKRYVPGGKEMVVAPPDAFASSMAARRLQKLPASAHTPFPGFASKLSLMVFTVKGPAACTRRALLLVRASARSSAANVNNDTRIRIENTGPAPREGDGFGVVIG